MDRFETVDNFIAAKEEWKVELELLRKLILSTALKEQVKWGMPVYCLGSKNVVGLGAFKGYVGIWFYQGVFLVDANKKLINAQENKTKGMRQWRFSSEKEIQENVNDIRAYLEEAIINQELGKEIKIARNKPLIIPSELQEALEANNEAMALFEVLTLGKKREFADYITEAKRAETKEKRINKIMPMILDGIGLGDKYRK